MADPVHQMQIGGPFPGREHAICPRRDALVKRVGGQIAPTRRTTTQLFQKHEISGMTTNYLFILS
jgi:hypothetical protein